MLPLPTCKCLRTHDYYGLEPWSFQLLCSWTSTMSGGLCTCGLGATITTTITTHPKKEKNPSYNPNCPVAEDRALRKGVDVNEAQPLRGKLTGACVDQES